MRYHIHLRFGKFYGWSWGSEFGGQEGRQGNVAWGGVV